MGDARRGLPTFLVIGGAKAGTTSLHHYLAQHPQVFMTAAKEPKFFALEGHPLDFRGPGDERIRTGTVTTLDAYRALFDGVRGERAAGESSTIYLNDERAPDAIARLVPDVKIVAVLRDPAARAYSAYMHLVRDGLEPLTDFAEALAEEPHRTAAGWYYQWRYRERGYWHRGLSRYFERFERSRIRVYLHEELDHDPGRVLADIFRFVGVDDRFRPDVSARHNVSGVPRNAGLQRLLRGSRPAREALRKVVPERWGHRLFASVQRRNLARPGLRPEIRADLVAGYREDVGRLEELLGRDLSSWRR